jgi:TRAP-type transport system small permease protein
MRLYRYYTAAVDALVVVCMVTMLVFVFTNVMLRIGFNSGIDIAEELPRYLFVWLAFLGGVIGVQRHSHIGVDLLVVALPLAGRRICWAISQVVSAICGFYIFYGTALQHDVIVGNVSPVMQISTVWVFGISYFAGAAIMAVAIVNLVRLMRGLVPDAELVGMGSEDIEPAEVKSGSAEGKPQ